MMATFCSARCLVVFVFVVFLAATSQGRARRVKRVIGGEHIEVGEWPWLVSLKAKVVTSRFLGIPVRHAYYYCGGSVLNDGWILTAAHCFDESSDPDDWEARLATVSLTADIIDKLKHLLGRLFGRSDWLQWEIDLDRIVIHPQYDKLDLWNNDIALVHLEDQVPSGPQYSDIQRIHLPSNGDSFLSTGDVCVMKGWGCTSAGGGVSKLAMKVDLPILSETRCKTYYDYKHLGNRICAGFRDSDAGICPGDSGGPLVCRDAVGTWTQVGVASFSSRFRPGEFPGAFTRISQYTDWIRTIID